MFENLYTFILRALPCLEENESCSYTHKHTHTHTHTHTGACDARS